MPDWATQFLNWAVGKIKPPEIFSYVIAAIVCIVIADAFRKSKLPTPIGWLLAIALGAFGIFCARWLVINWATLGT